MTGNQRGATISATNHRPQQYRPQQDSATAKKPSATRKINVGHNDIGQNHIGHKIKAYGEFIWRHRVDTYLFRVVRILNLNDTYARKLIRLPCYSEDECQVF